VPSLEPTIDIESLLQPIAGDNPAGESLQYSGLYDEIREARRADDNVGQGGDLKTSDWNEVLSLGTKALQERTKDLQVGAWLTEALLKLKGFAGLRDGLKLMGGLHHQFWEHVYPVIDEGDMDARANSLAWLDRQTAFGLKEVSLTNARGAESYSLLQWESTRLPEEFTKIAQGNAEEAARIKEKSEKATEEWARLTRDTSRQFYEDLSTLLDQCQSEFQALDRVMDEKFGRQTPGLSELKKSLDEVRTLIGKLVKEKRAAEPDEVGSDASSSQEQEVGTVASTSTSSVRGRQEALKRLAELADFFHKTEPHSPVSYLVQRAVKWGNMPLQDWLQDVIKDASVLGQLQETLGIKPGGEPGSSSW
jgi:type VI secretion system protein ImpA